MKSSQIIKELKKAGFVLVKVSDDHHKFKHKNGKIVIVPHPQKDLPIGTARNIYKLNSISGIQVLQKLLEGVKKRVYFPIKSNSIRKEPASTLQIRIEPQDMNLVLNTGIVFRILEFRKEQPKPRSQRLENLKI